MVAEGQWRQARRVVVGGAWQAGQRARNLGSGRVGVVVGAVTAAAPFFRPPFDTPFDCPFFPLPLLPLMFEDEDEEEEEVTDAAATACCSDTLIASSYALRTFAGLDESRAVVCGQPDVEDDDEVVDVIWLADAVVEPFRSLFVPGSVSEGAIA